MLLQGRSCPISKATAFRSPSSERGVSRGSHPRSVLPETTNTNKHPGGSYTRQLSTRSGQSGHAAWKDWGGTLNLHTRQLRAQRPIGTRCAGDCGGLMSACFCRHVFAKQFLPGSFCRHFGRHFRPQGPHGARGFFCERPPLPKRERGFVGRPCSEAPPKGEP